MKRLVQALAASAVLSCISTGAFAQSAYGCEDLDGFQALPSVEGSNGQFYRVDPELKNFFAFSKKLSSMGEVCSPSDLANSSSFSRCSALSFVGTAICT